MLREAVEAGMEVDHHALSTNLVFAPFYTSAKRIVSRIESQDTVPGDQNVHEFINRCKSRNKNVDVLVCAVVFLAAEPNPLNTADALALRQDKLAFAVQASNTNGIKLSQKLSRFFERVKTRTVTLFWWSLEISPTLKVVWDLDGNTRRWKIACVLPSFPSLVSSRSSSLLLLRRPSLSFLSALYLTKLTIVPDLSANLGRGRILPPNPTLHYSVKTRMEGGAGDFSRYGNDENVDEGKSYVPHTRFRKGQGWENVKFAE